MRGHVHAPAEGCLWVRRVIFKWTWDISRWGRTPCPVRCTGAQPGQRAASEALDATRVRCGFAPVFGAEGAAAAAEHARGGGAGPRRHHHHHHHRRQANGSTSASTMLGLGAEPPIFTRFYRGFQLFGSPARILPVYCARRNPNFHRVS